MVLQQLFLQGVAEIIEDELADCDEVSSLGELISLSIWLIDYTSAAGEDRLPASWTPSTTIPLPETLKSRCS